MIKKEYLFKTLSRTKRKDDENFVINAIWNGVSNYELKPVTQQYVNCGDKWYLIDLFFPQINLGIEVDEHGHLTQIEKDSIRSDQIVSAMKYNNKSDFTIERVITHSNNIDSVLMQIDNIIKIIKRKIDLLSSQLHWTTRTENLSNIRKNGTLKLDDDIVFGSITQTVNELFDYNRKTGGGPSRSFFKYRHDNSKYLWFAKRNVFKKGIELSVSGWINRLSHDGKEILEFRDDTFEISEPLGDKYEEDTNDIRITFLKFRNNLGEDGYKFAGVFKRVGWISTEFNGINIRAERYIRISVYTNLPLKEV